MGDGKFQSLEEADLFVKGLALSEQAYIYCALYLNGMRIDEAELLIRQSKTENQKSKIGK